MALPRVLLVEDEEDVLETLGHLLKRRGFSVIEASDGADALSGDKLQKVDIVVTDVRMPNTDGFELYRQAMLICPELPFIFISGHTIELGDIGVTGVNTFLLHKPFGIDVLEEAIHAQLEKSRSL